MGTSYNPKILTDGLVLNLDPANVKSYPAKQDPFVNNVSLMLSMDGANGSTTFTDSSANALSVTAFGNVQISTSQTKYGGASAYFDGDGDYLTATSGSLFQFPGDFTVEFWVYSTDTSASSLRGMFDTRSSQSSTSGIMLRENGFGYLVYGNGTTLISVGNVRSPNTWTHLALVRSGSTISLYINGTALVFTATDSTNYSDGQCLISGFVDTKASPYGFLGYIDDFRITKVARYTANFTPPTAPLSLPGRLTDLTKNRSIATLTNGPTYSGGSLVFDGTNDYITSPTSTLFNFATGDFTIEMWAYPTSVKTFSLLDFRINETNPNGNAFVIGTSASNLWVVYQNGNQITGPTVVANQWTQVVVNRVGTAVKMFLNRTQIGSTWTTSNSFTDGAFVLGTDYPLNARFFQGNISIIRIYKGKGLTSGEVYNNFVANRGRFGV